MKIIHNVDKRIIDVDDAQLIFHDVDVCELHFTNTDGETGIECVKKVRDTILSEKSTEKVYLIVTTEAGAQLTQDARYYASSKEFDIISYADAIVPADYNHEMAANFFIRFNRPERPVRLCPDMENAMAWIQVLRNLDY